MYNDSEMGAVKYRCMSTGLSVLVKYGDPVIDWWNAAYTRLVESGGYKSLCKEAAKKHGQLFVGYQNIFKDVFRRPKKVPFFV